MSTPPACTCADCRYHPREGRTYAACLCGEMLTGAVESCPRHPEVRLRTTEEKAAFARDFDARVTRSQTK